MANVIIIGNGPAGISAALYTARANIKTTIIGKDNGALNKARSIENYYGLEKPVSGTELVNTGKKQAESVGAQVIEDEVVGLGFDDEFIVKTKTCERKASVIVICTGAQRAKPKIKGIPEYEGRGISYCATCDAFFYRGKHAAVLGSRDYAITEAKELLQVAESVTLLTNGELPPAELPEGLDVNTASIFEFLGTDGAISGVLFNDGTKIELSGIFIAVGTAGSVDLAKKIGLAVDGTKIVVDSNMCTNIPGIYAAGDCTGGLLQIAKAVSEGAKAGTEIVKFLRKSHEPKSD